MRIFMFHKKSVERMVETVSTCQTRSGSMRFAWPPHYSPPNPLVDLQRNLSVGVRASYQIAT